MVALHYEGDSGNFSAKSNVKDPFWFHMMIVIYLGSPREVVHLFLISY